MIIMVHKTIIVQGSYRISIAGRVQEIKCLCNNGVNGVRLMSVRFIENQIEFY